LQQYQGIYVSFTASEIDKLTFFYCTVFVIPTKSFVKIGIPKYFVTTTKCLVLSTKRLVAAAKFLVATTKNLFIVPNFVAVTKHFFPCVYRTIFEIQRKKREGCSNQLVRNRRPRVER